MKRLCVLLTMQLLLGAGLFAQTGNPFELRWKEKDDTAYTYKEGAGPNAVEITAGNVEQEQAGTQPGSRPGETSGGEQEQTGDLAVAEPEESEGAPPPPVATEAPEKETGDDMPAADEERPPNIASPLVLLLLFGLVFVILTWAVNLTPGLVRKIYRAAFNENFSALLLREHKFASTQYLYYLVYIVFFINGGIFLYFLSRYSGWRFGYEQSPLIVFIGFVCFVYLIRHVVLTIIGITFPVSKEVTHFGFNIILYNILLGLTLIPINLFLAFGPSATHSWMIVVGLAAIGLFYLLRQARGVMIGGHLISKNVFQFFVYLCTIEILPVLVLLKFFHN